MSGIKRTRQDLAAWGKFQAALRVGRGWAHLNQIERMRLAALVGVQTSSAIGDGNEPKWVERITLAIESIPNPAVRRTLVEFYVKLDCKRSDLPRHVAAWLADGERQVMVFMLERGRRMLLSSGDW